MKSKISLSSRKRAVEKKSCISAHLKDIALKTQDGEKEVEAENLQIFLLFFLITVS